MRAEAKLKHARISAQKARLVADQIRGQHVEQALDTLSFSTKKGAGIVKKILESAIANAENNAKLAVDELKVKEAVVEEGPRMKRYWSRARGSMRPIVKRMCHIKIVLTDGQETDAA